jgi:hypothetical protein
LFWRRLLYDLNMLLIIGEVSGTENQEVAFDYAMRLSDGIDSAVVSYRKESFYF